jgi:multiple sugar transport system permease protein
VVREWLQGYAFAAPFIVGFVIFTAFPLGYSVYLSLHRWTPVSSPVFVGLDNFARLFHDEQTRQSLYNSVFYVAFAVPLQLFVSLALALALSRRIKFRTAYRAGFYLPVVLPLVAWSVIWQRILHPEFGLLNQVLGRLGMEPLNWLFDPTLAKPALILMSLWLIGHQIVILGTGLDHIPTALLEAAKIDGAGHWTRLRYIILPLLSPLLLYNLVVAVANSFLSFIPAQIVTEGGPQNATLFVMLHFYRSGFQYLDLGYAAALAWALMLLVLGFIVAQLYLAKQWICYEF